MVSGIFSSVTDIFRKGVVYGSPIRRPLERDVGSGRGPTRPDRRVPGAPRGLRPAVRHLAPRTRTTATHDRVPDRSPLEAQAQDRRRDRLPARSTTPRPPEVPRPGPLGRSAPAQDPFYPGGERLRGTRRFNGLE